MKTMEDRLGSAMSRLLIFTIVATAILTGVIEYLSYFDQMKTEVRNEAGAIASVANTQGEAAINAALGESTGSRITFIDMDGTVLYDSYADAKTMENHYNRPEISAAREKGTGEQTRYSDTIGRRTYYYAIRLSDGKFLRVSEPLESAFSSLMRGFTLIGLFTAALLVFTLLFAKKLTKKIVEPLNGMNLEHPLCGEVYEELRPLLNRVDEQNNLIRAQEEATRRSHEEYMAITENMREGLIVTNMDEVLSVNNSAIRLFRVSREDVTGHGIITVSRRPEVMDAWKTAVSGSHYDGQFLMEGRTFEIFGNPVLIDGEIRGAVLLIMDVTEKARTETLRREFTANVSHELKTPLMSISGYAELIEQGMVRQEDLSGFAGRIRGESARLAALVEDIIHLSELDEMKEDSPKEDTDLLEIAEEARKSLALTAENRGVTLTVQGEPVVIRGIRQVLYEMVRNLMDNGIKYNKEGGSVKVTVGKDRDHAFIRTADNGIGIPDADIERIFERFYRVDKSHSRATGGTGLGLSIVKHAVQLHDGRIVVESKQGKGTIFTIFL